MEGMEEEAAAAAKSAGGSPQGSKIASRIASPMEVTAIESSSPEQQLDNGHLPRPWLCPPEDRTPSPMTPHPPRAWRVQLQGPSVLEFKVRALREKMTAGKQGVNPDPTSHERASFKKLKCRRVKGSGEGSSLPDALVVSHDQTLTDGQLDGSVNDKEPARNGYPRPPRLPVPGLECWSRRSLWPPEAVWMLPDHERGLVPGPNSSQDSPVHRAAPSRPEGPGPCNKTTHTLNLRKGRSYPLRDGLATGGDLDSTSLTSQEDFVPRTPLLGGLWRAGDLAALGTGGSALSLSDRVERNRLLLQEMLSVSGQGPPKVGILAWTPSWDQAAPERPAGDMDWDSGISPQDSDQNRDHRRSPALDPRVTFPSRDSPQNGNLSDSSSGESSSGLWPKQSASPSSHVRFEDESAGDVESRYLERQQQRQRQVLNSVLQAVDQGPLRSKPDLTNYVNGGERRRDAGEGALHRLAGRLHRWGLPPPPLPPPNSERKCRACGNCIEQQRPMEGRAPPNPRILQEIEAACGVEGVLAESHSSRGLSSPVRFLFAEPGLHAEWIRETHIGDTVRPEEVDSALDSTDTSHSCRTVGEELGISQPSRTRGRTRASRPREGHRLSRKMELPRGPEAQHRLPDVDHVEVGDEGKEGRGHTPAGTLCSREDAVPKPPALESKRASLGPQWQHGPGLGNPGAHLADSPPPCRTAYATTSSMNFQLSGPGRQAQVIESHESLETASSFSLEQSHAEPSAPHQAQQPVASLSSEGRVPTPPSSRKTASSPMPHRKAALAGSCRAGDLRDPGDTSLPSSRSVVPRTCERMPPQIQSRSPQVRRPLLALSTNNCNNGEPPGLQEPWGEATPEGRVERGPCSQEAEPPPENSREGGLQGFPGPAAIGTISSTGTTLSLALEEPDEGPQRTEPRSGGRVPSGASPGVSAGLSPPSAAPPERNKKSGSSIASTLGLKKFFAALGQSTRPKLGKSRSYSVEQLQSPAPNPASHTSTPKVKRIPSLQSLHLVSPSHQHRKAASFQNLYSLLSNKVDRSSLYLVGEPEDHSATGRLAKAPPRRALSVEDVGAPSLARAVGRVVEVYPDGTSQLKLQRSPEGTFGFCVASGNGRRDSGHQEKAHDPPTECSNVTGFPGSPNWPLGAPFPQGSGIPAQVFVGRSCGWFPNPSFTHSFLYAYLCAFAGVPFPQATLTPWWLSQILEGAALGSMPDLGPAPLPPQNLVPLALYCGSFHVELLAYPLPNLLGHNGTSLTLLPRLFSTTNL
ncbi:uncharacterized protein KIAA1614 homolog isoform X3 [Elephas maximus indicus]|uniref:uncharacterized protein KIAA1614 homolog isoform X3 n=1 Tax=Elephas maximus indicus TaxID=99487 RepID=UPI0021169F83|nr:uncharacterized protein KIAA1614 homolog isoform X3 [Elephas maximus indicus]